jgi:hypothetical protein
MFRRTVDLAVNNIVEALGGTPPVVSYGKPDHKPLKAYDRRGLDVATKRVVHAPVLMRVPPRWHGVHVRISEGHPRIARSGAERAQHGYG